MRSAGSIFVDSGAFSLYTRHIKSLGKKAPSNYYDLTKGSEFRTYCDKYAKFVKAMRGRVLVANVDAIYNPEKTWEIQKFFEQEHGVFPVPVIHFRTPFTWLDKYLESTMPDGKPMYDLIGVGGFSWGGKGKQWLDSFFLHVCPKENDYIPRIKVHGFALTSWSSIVRYPWWSVDSTSWFATAGYGGIFMPRFRRGQWVYNEPPYVLQVSDRSVSKAIKGRHFHSLAGMAKGIVNQWLAEVGVTMQEVSGEGNKIGRGEDPSYIARSKVNLLYFKNLEESRPEWPCPLDTRIVRASSARYHRGFGL